MRSKAFILLATLESAKETFAFTSRLINNNNRLPQHSTCTKSSLDCFTDGSNFGGLNQNSLMRNKLAFSRKSSLAAKFGEEYSDFDNDDDDDDDDDDDYIDLDDKAVANFKAMMGIPEESKDLEDDDEDDNEYPEIIEDSDLSSISSVDELISFATTKGEGVDTPSTDWATPLELADVSKALESGVCLIANPAKFCDDFAVDKSPSLALLSKFGLTLPPPPELGADRRADLLPVLILLDRHPLKGCHALLLNRRTGYLIGDLENQQLDEDGNNSSPPPNLGAFMIQPLWFGGTASGGDQSNSLNGLDMIHVCPIVDGAKQITDDGLFHGGDPVQAQEAMTDPSLERIMTGFDFKFFVQSTRWLPMQLEKEIRDGSWIVASVSKEVLFKSRDRLGAKRAKPLWTEIMELLGGEYKDIRDKLYDDQ